MGSDILVFQPIRRQLGIWCGVIFLGILINVHYLLDSSSMIICLPLVFLIVIFIILFVPLLKNQKLIVINEDVLLFTFGRINRLVFCENLREIVVKENETISYRFEKNGKYFQISPRAYYDDVELALLFSNLNNKCRGIVSVVEK